MAAFSAVQPFADALLFFLPLYFPAKLAFACYLWVNNLAGAELVYTRYVQPVVTKYEPLVDKQIAEAREMATNIVSRTFSQAVQWLQAKIVAALANSNQPLNGGDKIVCDLQLFFYITLVILYNLHQFITNIQLITDLQNSLRADSAGQAAPAAGFRSDSFLSAASSFGRSFSSKSD